LARTIIVSDLHGSAAMLDRTVEHSGLTAADTLVIAGDLVDIGPDDVISRARELGAIILVGNHEVAAALGLRISPQHPESLVRGPEFARLMREGEWPLAMAVDGWLVTHAGVSTALDDIIVNEGLDAELVAADLNRRFADEITDASARVPAEWDSLERYRTLNCSSGPLWFRPMHLSQVPAGVHQIVGHTPPEVLGDAAIDRLADLGWLLIEPGGHGDSGGLRYAIVEDGTARVVEA
jgi:hypothetical protein